MHNQIISPEFTHSLLEGSSWDSGSTGNLQGPWNLQDSQRLLPRGIKWRAGSPLPATSCAGNSRDPFLSPMLGQTFKHGAAFESTTLLWVIHHPGSYGNSCFLGVSLIPYLGWVDFYSHHPRKSYTVGTFVTMFTISFNCSNTCNCHVGHSSKHG